MSSNVDEDILGTEATAHLLRCSERTVEEQARSGDLPGLKYGDGGWIFPRPALMQRLTEKALEQASARREKTTPKPAGIGVPIPAARTGGRRRTPVPSLGAAT